MATAGRTTLTLGAGVTSGSAPEYRSPHDGPWLGTRKISVVPPIDRRISADKPDRRMRLAAHDMMNETVYLFALSLPDLLDRIVTDRDEVRAPAPQPAAPDPRT